MRNSYKSRRSEIARIMAFDHLVRQKVIKIRPYLKEVDIHILMCADYMADKHYDIFTISELKEVCCLPSSTVHASKQRLLRHELLQCYHIPKKWYSPREQILPLGRNTMQIVNT